MCVDEAHRSKASICVANTTYQFPQDCHYAPPTKEQKIPETWAVWPAGHLSLTEHLCMYSATLEVDKGLCPLL
jgi:hypothetical protein